MRRTCIAVLLLSACAGMEDEPEIGQDDLEITDGSNVPDGHVLLDTTATIGNCTATIIGPQHVLTAAHCKPRPGSTTVWFYDGTGIDPGDGTAVTEVWERYGVYDQVNDLEDDGGYFADFAVLKLAQEIPAYAMPARLPHLRHAEGSNVLAVGAGNHDGQNNGSRLRLRYRSNQVRWYEDRAVFTESAITNPGDSGGPIYSSWNTEPIVHGALWGTYYDAGSVAYRNRYASTYEWSWEILEAMGHTPLEGRDRPGNNYEVKTVSKQLECSIECMQDERCRAYTYTKSTRRCELKNAQSGSLVTSSDKIYARKVDWVACTPNSQGVCRM